MDKSNLENRLVLLAEIRPFILNSSRCLWVGVSSWGIHKDIYTSYLIPLPPELTLTILKTMWSEFLTHKLSGLPRNMVIQDVSDHTCFNMESVYPLFNSS